MTKALQELLTQYGILSITISGLRRQRPGNEHESLEAYYKSFGCPLPDEPVLVVRVSKDDEIHFLDEGVDTAPGVLAVVHLLLSKRTYPYKAAPVSPRHESIRSA